MPLRHTFNEINIKLCIEYINNFITESNEPIYNRFYQASITSLSKIISLKETLYISDKLHNDFIPVLDSNSTKKISFVYNKKVYDEEIYKEFANNIKTNTNQNIM